MNYTGGLYSADLFLEHVIPEIEESPAFKEGGLIDVTFDEGFPPFTYSGNSFANSTLVAPDAATSVGTDSTDATTGGGDTGSVLISPYITPGTLSTVYYNHYRWLRTMEYLFNVKSASPGLDKKGHIGYAAQPGLAPFGPDVFNNPKGPKKERHH